MTEIARSLRGLVDELSNVQAAADIAVAGAAKALSTNELAELIVGARTVRNRLFGSKLFGEPAWDILLDLYVTHGKGQSISVSSASLAGGTPATTGLRWLSTLDREGFIERRGDDIDQRRQFVSLSDHGVVQMDNFMTKFADWVSTRATVRKSTAP